MFSNTFHQKLPKFLSSYLQKLSSRIDQLVKTPQTISPFYALSVQPLILGLEVSICKQYDPSNMTRTEERFRKYTSITCKYAAALLCQALSRRLNVTNLRPTANKTVIWCYCQTVNIFVMCCYNCFSFQS